MALTGPAPRVGSNRYLDGLLAEVDALVARVAAAPASERRVVAEQQHADAALATLQLDGADRDLLTQPAEAAAAVARHTEAVELATPRPRSGRSDAPPGTWLDAFGAVEANDELLRAHEVVGAMAGLAADDLAPAIVGDRGLEALRELHARLTVGLVAEHRAGAARAFAQAVHDASVGRILYLTTEPTAIGDELDRLGRWLATAAPELHPVVATGVLHGELLRIHPFDAANGRLARTAARLGVRAAGLDPDGLSAPEPVLADDPMAYHLAMADTLRRRDLTRWVERWAEALAAGLRRSARTLGVLDAAAPERAAAFVARREAFTLGDYLAVVDGDRDAAAADLGLLLDAGTISRVLGTHGLRFVVTV